MAPGETVYSIARLYAAASEPAGRSSDDAIHEGFVCRDELERDKDGRIVVANIEFAAQV